YVEALREIVTLAKSLLGEGTTTDENTRAFLEGVITRLAPPLLQYTETSIEVRLDLSQSFQATGSITAGGNIGAVAVSATASAAYGFDYRAAAVVRSVINARNLDTTVMTNLLARAQALNTEGLTLPDLPAFNQQLLSTLQGVSSDLGGNPAEVDTADTATTPAPTTPATT
ncbi:MAG: hypothetical protein AAF657_32955, partial [Acidobacteriota bacterium]